MIKQALLRKEAAPKSTTELTKEYIKDHPSIKNCLRMGLVNYSALARLIAKELHIERKMSMEAILVAARRFQMELGKDRVQVEQIKNMLARSEVELRNKITVLIVEKSFDFEYINSIHQRIHTEHNPFYFLEGSDNYTIITAEKYLPLLEAKLKGKILKKHHNLALIMFKSAKEIESQLGVIAYLTSLFAENGVNIVEFLSCWTDTLFVIDTKDVPGALAFLRF